MTMLLLHGSFVDDFVIELALPLAIFVGLYWWADRKSKRAKAAKDAAAPTGAPTGEERKTK